MSGLIGHTGLILPPADSGLGTSLFDATAVGAGVTLGGGNTTAACASTGNARLDTARSSGVWQFTILVGADTGLFSIIGFAETAVGTSGFPGSHTNSWGLWNRTGQRFNNSSPTSYGPGFITGDYIEWVIDFPRGLAYAFKNGTSYGSFSHGLSGALVPMVGNGGGGGGTANHTVILTSPYPKPGVLQW